MHSIPLFFVFMFILIPVAVVVILILILVRLFRGPRGQKAQEEQVDEARMIQELYQGLNRLEGRLESLETLLLDQERKEDRS